MVTVIDLFAGCGGLSLGAARVGLGPSLAVELDDHAATAHSKNFPACQTAKLDLSVTDPSTVRSMVGERADLVVGGPPCQGFSYIGKRDRDDPRNGLLGRFFEYVSELRPRAFLMENVPGLLDSSSVGMLERGIERIDGVYSVLPPLLLDAADFGAATRRKRVVVIGYDAAEADPIDPKEILASVLAPTSVANALEGLPSPGKKDVKQVSRGVNSYVEYINRAVPGVGDPTKLKDFELGLVSGFSETVHSEDVALRFSSTGVGQVEKVSRYFRLNPDEPARTLRAGTGADRGSFQSARPIHHHEARVVSVREAARIQGFPDWFDFHPTKWHSHRMIGNSVSPLFAEAVLKPVAVSLGVEGNYFLGREDNVERRDELYSV